MESPKNVPSSQKPAPGQPSQGGNLGAPGGKFDPSQANARPDDKSGGDKSKDQDTEIGDRKGNKENAPITAAPESEPEQK